MSKALNCFAKKIFFQDFETKINNMILKVAWSIGIDVGDRFRSGARKLKFVVNSPLPPDTEFPRFDSFVLCY